MDQVGPNTKEREWESDEGQRKRRVENAMWVLGKVREIREDAALMSEIREFVQERRVELARLLEEIG